MIWLFPFKTYYLKCGANRETVHQRMLELTFLSDDGYKRTGEGKMFFFGTLGIEDFDVESISTDNRLVDYISGRLKGAGNDMYVILTLKAFKVRRIYLIFLILMLAMTGFAISEFLTWGMAVFRTPTFMLLSVVVLALMGYLIFECSKFWKKQKTSLDFFRGLFEADTVRYKDIPVVFRL